MSRADPREAKGLALLAGLDEEERAALAEELEPLELAEGSELFAEGDPGEALFFVVEGGVRVQSRRAGRAGDLGPGASLGAFSLVEGGPREVRAETTSRTRLLVLRRSAWRRFAEAEPRAACRLLEAILRETASLGREALAEAARGGVDRPSARD